MRRVSYGLVMSLAAGFLFSGDPSAAGEARKCLGEVIPIDYATRLSWKARSRLT